MPALKYKVTLTEDEKLGLEALIHKGKASARSLTRARIDTGRTGRIGPL
jgi:hypothetical protein